MSEGERQVRPGHAAPEAAELRDAAEESFVPGGAQRDPAWTLRDRMRMVRAERQGAAAQIQRSLTAWRKEAGGGGGASDVKIPAGGGAPLAADVRKKMEPRLGADLSGVKVHTSGEAANAAEGLGARAFTVGEEVHFGAGQFQPGTKEGDRLLAHELTHVVQGQRSGIQRKADEAKGGASGDSDKGEGLEVSQPEDAAEKEADAVADQVADGMHGKDKAKGKGKKDDKKKGAQAKGGAHDSDAPADEAHGDGKHGAAHDSDAHDDAHGDGAHGNAQANAAHGGAAAHGTDGAAHDSDGAQAAPGEKPAPISAKLIGAGRKIFRAPGPTAPRPATPATGPTTSSTQAGATAGAPPANPNEAAIDARLTRERAAVQAATSLGGIAAALAGAANPGQALVKLNNAEASVRRATTAFTAAARTDPMMASAQAEFVDSRYGKAVAGQKNGILAAIDKMKAQKGTPKFADVNYGDAQWDATTKSMDQSVLLPENLNSGSAAASMDVAKQRGGIIKLFSMGQFFGNMSQQLQTLWTQVYGGDRNAARAAWSAASVGVPAIVPPASALADATKNTRRWQASDFTAAAPDLSSAFTKEVTGSVGFAQDYASIANISDAVAQLGLRPNEYVGGGYIAKIPANQLDKAMANANNAQNGPGAGGATANAKNIIGKPTLFTSLLFAEFNYIVEDRLINRTAVNDTNNTGKPDPKGKDELAVVKVPISEFLSGGLTYLPG